MTGGLSGTLALDLETMTKTLNKRKASPFHPGNWIVAAGWKFGGGAVEHRYYASQERARQPLLAELLAKRPAVILTFNGKFDILHLLAQHPDNLPAWMAWVAEGGQIFCSQLAEYLLEGMAQRDQMLSLDEVAPRYGGNVKLDEVKALWAVGVETNDIDKGLLLRYLCGGPDETDTYQLGDVENTEKIALAQIKRARECGQLKSLMLNMGSLLFTIEAERNGMFVDLPLGLSIAAELEASILDVKAGLVQYVPEGLPFEFKWTSRHHKSALIFGGQVRHDRREWQLADGNWTFDAPLGATVGQYAYAQKDESRWLCDDAGHEPAAGQSVLGPTTDQPPPLNVLRFKGGKNAGEPKSKKVKVPDHAKPKTRMGEDFHAFAGFTAPSKAWATTEPGVYKVNDEVIEELGVRNIPFLKALSKLQSMVKDLGTYYLTTDPDTGERKGMLSLVGDAGIIHHSVNHTSTVTGRFSASNPNLQNLPKGNKSRVKAVLASRFGAAGKIIQSDFSSLEIYIQAILTDCKQLIADLRANLDMHVKRLAVKEGKTYAEVLLLCKGDEARGIEPVSEWDYKRTGAKVFSFQRAYGAGAAKIAATTGMPIEDVQALIEAESVEYPEVDTYYEDLTRRIKENRHPTGRVIPHPDIPGIMCHLGEATYRTPDGKLYRYSEHPAPEFLIRDRNGRQRKDAVYTSFSPTEIKNYVVQGEGAEFMKAAMWLTVRAFYARGNFGGQALIVNTVHDASYLDAHDSVAFESAALLHACMEAASDFMEWYFNWPLAVPVPSDTSQGPSMLEEHKVPGIKERAAVLRTDLRATYMRGYVPSYLKK